MKNSSKSPLVLHYWDLLRSNRVNIYLLEQLYRSKHKFELGNLPEVDF